MTYDQSTLSQITASLKDCFRLVDKLGSGVFHLARALDSVQHLAETRDRVKSELTPAPSDNKTLTQLNADIRYLTQRTNHHEEILDAMAGELHKLKEKDEDDGK